MAVVRPVCAFLTGVFSCLFLTSVSAVNDTTRCYSSEINGLTTKCRKIPLYIGGMMSMSGGWDGSGCLVAAELALEQINNRSDILADYELKMLWNDTQCDSGRATRILFDHIFSDTRKIILLGPACSRSAHPVAAASRYWNFITVLYSATSASLSDREKYPYVYRSVPNGVSVYNGPYLWIIKNYGWRRLAVIYDPNDAFTARLEDINKRTEDINTTILSEVIDKEAKNLIENLKDEDVRIIIVDAFEGDARRIFCEAYNAGLYGPDIFWMLPGWYNPKWWRLESDVEGCTTEEIAMVVETSLPLGVDVSPLSAINNITVAGITPLEFQEEMRRRLQWPKYEGITENGYMSYSFDAVWAIGLMLNKTVEVLHQRNSSLRLEKFSYNDPALTEIFLEEFATTRFFGASGDLAFVDGERLGYSKITQIQGRCKIGWNLNKRSCYQFRREEPMVNWTTAEKICETHKAVLVDIATEEDVDVLLEMFSKETNMTPHLWNVGLRVVILNGNSMKYELRNINNIPVQLQYVEPATESEVCVYIDFKENGTLKSGICSDEKPFICKMAADFDYVTVATFDSVADEMIWMNDIVWPGGKVPVDGVPEFVKSTVDEIEQMIPASVHVVMSSIAVVGIILTFLAAFFVICFSKRPIISASSPALLFILLLGALLMYSSVIFNKSRLLQSLGHTQHVLLCEIQSMMASIGFILAVSVLVSKMWSVYKANWVYKKADVESYWWLVLIVAISLVVDISLLILNHLLYPLDIAKVILMQRTDPTNPHHQTISYVEICAAKDPFIRVALSVLDKVALVLVGLFLTIEIRQVKKSSFSLLDDSQLVAASIYNIIIFSSCGLILTILLRNDPTNLYVFSSALILCCATFTLLVMFVPKIVYIARASGERRAETDDTPLSTMAGTSTSISSESNMSASAMKYRDQIPVALFNENIELTQKFRELEKLVQRRKDRTKEGALTEALSTENHGLQ